MEARIIELEKKILYQDRTIEELSQEVADQQKQIANLERSLKLIKAQLESGGDLVKKIEDEVPPPHY